VDDDVARYTLSCPRLPKNNVPSFVDVTLSGKILASANVIS
jgi:hypothetical protein